MKKLVFTKEAFVTGEHALDYLKEIKAGCAVNCNGWQLHVPHRCH